MELGLYFKFLLALCFVLGLIAALAWAARRFGLAGRLTPNSGKNRRLAIVEVMTLDARRKLVLLKCDRTEHLVLLGASQDLLLESAAAPAASRDPATPEDDEAAA